jgi:hypothetical protein
VLSRFGSDEMAIVEKVNAAVAENMGLFWKRSPEVLATKVALTLNPPAPKPPKKVADEDGI